MGPQRIARTRADELEAAVGILAPRVVVLRLGHRDRELLGRGGAAERVVRGLVGALLDGAMGAVAWSRDPHVDRERVAALIRRALAAMPDLRLVRDLVRGRVDGGAMPSDLVVLRAACVLRAGCAAPGARHRAAARGTMRMTRPTDDAPDGVLTGPGHRARVLDHPEIPVAA